MMAILGRDTKQQASTVAVIIILALCCPRSHAGIGQIDPDLILNLGSTSVACHPGDDLPDDAADAVPLTVSAIGVPLQGTIEFTVTGGGSVRILNNEQTQAVASVDVGSLPVTLWVQGLSTSRTIDDVEIRAVWRDQGTVRDSETRKLTVVAIKDVQYRRGDDWRTIVKTSDGARSLWVLTGSTVTFRAIPQPAEADWPDDKPVWGGHPGSSGQGGWAVPFSQIGTVEVTAECGLTETVTVTVDDFVVEFSKEEVRPGETGASRAETVTATAKRTSPGPEITLQLTSTNQRAAVNPNTLTIAADAVEGAAELTVTGSARSPDNRDTRILADVEQSTKGALPVTVTYPARWTSDVETAAYQPVYTTTDAGNNLYRLRWSKTSVFTVEDQFNVRLSPHWCGASGIRFWESSDPPNEQGWVGFNGQVGDLLDENAQAFDPIFIELVVGAYQLWEIENTINPNNWPPAVQEFGMKFGWSDGGDIVEFTERNLRRISIEFNMLFARWTLAVFRDTKR